MDPYFCVAIEHADDAEGNLLPQYTTYWHPIEPTDAQVLADDLWQTAKAHGLPCCQPKATDDAYPTLVCQLSLYNLADDLLHNLADNLPAQSRNLADSLSRRSLCAF